MLSVLLNNIVAFYSLPKEQEGLMSSLISAGSLIALAALFLVNNKKRKAFLISAGGLLMSAMLIVKSIHIPFSVFLAACFICGIGIGMIDTCQNSFLADLHGKDTPKKMGVMHGVYGAVSVLIPLLLKLLLGYFDWHTLYLFAGLYCTAMIGQFFLATLTVGKKMLLAEPEERGNYKIVVQILKCRCYVYLLLYSFFAAAAQQGIILWTVRYVSVYIHAPEIATFALSTFWITVTVSRFAAPYVPIRSTIITACGSAVCALAWACAVAYGNSYGFWVACFLIGLASGCYIPIVLSESASLCPEHTGTATSVLLIAKTIGQMISPLLISGMAGLTSMKTGMYVAAICFLTAAVLGMAVVREQKTTTIYLH